jgi:hypothetical protein
MHIKTIHGRQYWYDSYREDGKVKSRYIEPVLPRRRAKK